MSISWFFSFIYFVVFISFSRVFFFHVNIIFFFYCFESFSHQRYQMVFHWSLNDNKYFQVSKTLLGIQADLNDIIVGVISVGPLISSSLRTFPSAPNLIDVIVTFMFHNLFFSSLTSSKSLSYFSFSLIFTLWSTETVNSSIRLVLSFLFFVYYPLVWSTGWHKEIYLYLKILDNFVSHFLDGVWFEHIPFRSMAKLQFLARFPVNYIPRPVMSNIIFISE